MRIIKLMMLLVFLFLGNFSLHAQSGAEAIQSAAKENKHLFIFFYKDLNEKTLKSQSIFDETMNVIGDRAKSIKIKITDPSEKQIVDQFDLKRSPMPFAVVLAPNGAVTGGFPYNFTEEQLTHCFSSPAMAKCLKALQENKLVFLCLQNTETFNNETALEGVKNFKADNRFNDATEIVFVNPSDAEESIFLNQLCLDTHATEALTVLLSPPAEIIGKYYGATNKQQILSDLENAASGCCGPGGCCPGGSCGSK